MSPRMIVISTLYLTAAVCFSVGSVAWFHAYITPCFGSGNPHGDVNETHLPTAVYSVLMREMPLVLRAISLMLTVAATVFLMVSLLCHNPVDICRVSFNMYLIVGVMHLLQELVWRTRGEQHLHHRHQGAQSRDQFVLWTTSVSAALFLLLKLEQCCNDCLCPPPTPSCCCCLSPCCCFPPSPSSSSLPSSVSLLSTLSSSPPSYSWPQGETASAKSELHRLLTTDDVSESGRDGAQVCSESSVEESVEHFDLQMDELADVCAVRENGHASDSVSH